VVCHGADRSGTPNGASLLGVASRLSAEEMRSIITNGKGRMQPLPQLSTTDVDAVVAYLAVADGRGGGGGRGRGAASARCVSTGSCRASQVPRWFGKEEVVAAGAAAA
jgi:mono/diheme cytochrome c family protein